MATSRTKFHKTALAGFAVGPSPAEYDDEVIGLREWGTNVLFPLRVPADSSQVGTANATTLQWLRGDRDPPITANGVELVYENETWRVKDGSDVSSVMQNGDPTREASLRAGTEVTVAHRTFIAESARSIALRNFCSRLLGWSDAVVIEQALRAIRLASAGRAALILHGTRDLVSFAYAIHRRTRGDNAPFVVSDHRRNNTARDTARSRANLTYGMAAFRRASGGTLCVHTNRLPRDFGAILSAFRNPANRVRLMVCSDGLRAHVRFDVAAQIEIPSLKARRSDLFRIVSEYATEAVSMFGVLDDCLDVQDVEWILERATLRDEATILDIEKAVWRAIAVKKTKNPSAAAKLLGIAPISLARWMTRRKWNDE
jgi:hypothetical protein